MINFDRVVRRSLHQMWDERVVFASIDFIFIFLPIALFLFYFIGKNIGHNMAIALLMLMSVIFYGYWSIKYIPLLLGSILFNYIFSRLITSPVITSEMNRKYLLVFSIASNILLLAYFKYYNFFIGTLNAVINTELANQNIILPLGISFYTFTQIAYLVDTYRSGCSEKSFWNYGLFVTIFPHLIAGPIIHHSNILPQFKQKIKFCYENLTIGLCIFSIGLIKKVLFADHIGNIADIIFNSAELEHLSFLEAWAGAIAYSFQIYFDFSGYADMAIGLARMLGITFPENFNSPYKSVNIIDFWRSWHITLSNFLKNYLYIPLGGNRNGFFRRYLNILITMLIGGLWHGANWTFVLWGGLHGSYLIINHFWRNTFGKKKGKSELNLLNGFYWLLTFISVSLAWVLFRSNNSNQAISMLYPMLDLKSFFTDQIYSIKALFPTPVYIVWWHEALEFFVLFFIVLVLPNTQQIMEKYNPILGGVNTTPSIKYMNVLQWRPTILNLLAYSSIFVLAILIIFVGISHDFIYYQF